MKIFINDTEVTIFNGAKVKDVLRKYSMEEFKEVKKGKMYVHDKYGNKVMLGGELREGEELFTKTD
ncbi:MAG: hypothetical protein ABR596_01355 [Halarsenatibacteraceae bacterium]